MKKVLFIAIVFVCMLSLFACAENDGENGSSGDAVKDSGKVLFTSDDVVTQSSSVKTKLCTVKKVNDDGTITVTEWSKTENENGEYTFTLPATCLQFCSLQFYFGAGITAHLTFIW